MSKQTIQIKKLQGNTKLLWTHRNYKSEYCYVYKSWTSVCHLLDPCHKTWTYSPVQSYMFDPP